MGLLRLFVSRTFRLAPVLILAVLLMFGMTPLWSQSSDSNLSGYDKTSLIWKNFSVRFQTELNGLRTDLSTALKDAKQSKTSSEKWMFLYERSLTRISNLERYNEQIAERMQESDEDLAAAYQELDEQDKKLLKKDNIILKLVIAVSALGLLVIGAVIFALLKGYIKLKLPVKLQ